jgi:DNA polymerase-3 subunit gamma/tau
MSYQVLARKWRPRNFSELVGQEHVMRALVNALDNDRLHHAFLFTGTRGVGKTTIARILAKSLNCERGVSSTPCGTCGACTEIDQGRFVDLIEVDAASRTKVEDTRELLENVQYAPTRGRYKVYLIDEVHMLSTHSFNALLKTLEEPPPHVKFLLATTDPQRLPITILSRCLQFNLKRLPLPAIQKQLEKLLAQESIGADAESTAMLARAADGSMRDALSLLDQAIAFCGGSLNHADVGAMLGTIDRGQVFEILDALGRRDARALFTCVQGLAQQSPDFGGVLAELNATLQRVALAQQLPDAIDDAHSDRERVLQCARALDANDVQLFYQIGIMGRRDLPLASDPQSGFEMVLLRMLAFTPNAAAQATRAEVAGDTRPTPSAPLRAAESAPTATNTPPPSAPPAGLPTSATWDTWVGTLRLTGLAKQLAANTVLAAADERSVRLQLRKGNAHVLSDAARDRLQAALQGQLGAALRLTIDVVDDLGQESPAQLEQRRQQARHEAAQRTVQDDAGVKALIDTFNARIDGDSVRPLE